MRGQGGGGATHIGLDALGPAPEEDLQVLVPAGGPVTAWRLGL
jgi:hypothetical protein